MVVRARNRRWQELEKDNLTLERLARHFETYNRSEGKSPKTIEWYERVLRFFQEYLREQGHTTRFGDLNIDVAREFVLYLKTRRKLNNHPYIPSPDGNLKAISVQTMSGALEHFSTGCIRRVIPKKTC